MAAETSQHNPLSKIPNKALCWPTGTLQSGFCLLLFYVLTPIKPYEAQEALKAQTRPQTK